MSAIAARRAHTLARSERRRRRRQSDSVPTSSGYAPSPDQELAANRTAAKLRNAVAQLASRRREAVLLRMDAGLDYAEIATVLETSEGAVRVLVHRALAELESKLGDEL